MGPRNHVFDGGPDPHGKGQFWGIGAPYLLTYSLLSIGTFCRELYKTAELIDLQFGLWAWVDRSPKDAHVQLYSPKGDNVPLWEDTLPPPGEYDWTIRLRGRCALCQITLTNVIFFMHTHLDSRTDSRARFEPNIVLWAFHTIQPSSYSWLADGNQCFAYILSTHCRPISFSYKKLLGRCDSERELFTTTSYTKSVKWRKIRAITPFKVIQGHRFWYQLKDHVRLSISD